MNEMKFKSIFKYSIKTISDYYLLKPEIYFQLEKERNNNLILKLMLKKERNLNTNLKFKLQKQIIITEELNNKNICSICRDRTISICCIPCGHTYCNICISNAKNCFICKKTIIFTNRIYI